MFTLIGSIVILGYNFDISTMHTKGNLYAILCSVCLAIAFMIAEKVRANETTIVYTRLLYLSASITLLVILFITSNDIIND